MMDFFWKYYLAVKYFAQGDSWGDAVKFAQILVGGFKR
jgi:hypothetical protein